MIGCPIDSKSINKECTLHAKGKNFEFPRTIFFRGKHFIFGPQSIAEGLRAIFSDLEWTFGPFKTIPGPKKILNLENGILSVKILSVKSFLADNGMSATIEYSPKAYVQGILLIVPCAC